MCQGCGYDGDELQGETKMMAVVMVVVVFVFSVLCCVEVPTKAPRVVVVVVSRHVFFGVIYRCVVEVEAPQLDEESKVCFSRW